MRLTLSAFFCLLLTLLLRLDDCRAIILKAESNPNRTQKTLANTVDYVDPPLTLISKTSYEFTISYNLDEPADLHFEFWSDKWLAGHVKALQVGSNTAYTFTVTLSEPPAAGEGYRYKVYMTKPGQNWMNMVIGAPDFTGVEVTVDFTEDDISFDSAPKVLPSLSKYTFGVDYKALAEREIVFELWSPEGMIGSGTETVQGGARTGAVEVVLDSPLPIADDYSYKTYMLIPGESNPVASATDFTGVSVIDPSKNVCGDTIVEKDGLVIIEAENIDIEGTQWQRTTSKTGYSGVSYLEWLGNDNFATPGSGVISAKIKITKTGKYRFQWRSRVGKGTNSTEHNDSWLRFPDASDFYGEKAGKKIFPKGSGKTPLPNGAGADGWFKVFLSGTANWTWVSSTSDNDSHQVFVEFDAPGVYIMEISGRSKNHLLDRIVMFNGATNPLDLTKGESDCIGAKDPDVIDPDVTDPDIVLNTSHTLSNQGIVVYPIPAVGVLYIDGLEIGDQAYVTNVQGQVVTSKIKVSERGRSQIDISHLPTGINFLVIENKGVQKIIK